MCLSACLPEPPMGSDAAIFKRPSRYGWGASGGRPTAAAQEPKKQQRPSNNRFGHTENKPKPNNSGSNSSPSGSNSETGSDSGSSSNGAPSSNVADADDNKKMTDSGSSGSESGSSSGGDTSPGGSNKSSSSTPPSNLNDYPYARLVPGKKGAVTLPGVGEIDVTGIKPGTPVEIDDPNNPGKKIYFRVP